MPVCRGGNGITRCYPGARRVQHEIDPRAVSLLLLAAAIIGGTAATYLYEDDEPLGARLAIGVPIGIIVLGHAGFLFSSLLGLGGAAITAAALVVLLPITALG